MSDTLSKDEVDALLQGVQDGDVAVEGEQVPRGTVRPYDLFAEDRLSGRRFSTLDLVHERFVKRLGVTLARLVGVTPTITLGTLETIRFAVFRNRLPTGACLQLFTMAPLRGQALLAISAPLAFGLVDRVFGGPGRLPETLEGREYSTLELQTLQRVGSRVLADLGEAWTPVQRVDCTFVRVEPNPAYLTVAAPADAVVTVEVACDLGVGPASIIVALPYAMLEPLRDRLGAAEITPATGTDREWVKTVSAAVRQADVTVSAELGNHEISARELLRLRVGDVLPLGARDDDPVTLRVENVRVMTGLAGVSRGQNAVRVLGGGRGE
jgi:flagellar motor switch protein FliM